jgi:pimeloyl-ACP methyl ester carboxylesterase
MAFSERRVQSADGLALAVRDLPGPLGGSRVPVLCLPGLTRNARDFEALAAELARERRVLSPDLRGRGRSAWDPEPAHYRPATYLADVLRILDELRVPRVIAIGTSLGGLLTMLLAAARPEALAAAVLNDIGPVLEPEGIARIRAYVGRGGAMKSWGAAAAACRDAQGIAFPGLDDAGWLAFARRTCIEGPDGAVRFDYDPRIAEAVADPAPSSDPWLLWRPLLAIPTLVVRGEISDILSIGTLAEMKRRKPDLHTVTVPGRGHAPLLDEPEALQAIRSFLAER